MCRSLLQVPLFPYRGIAISRDRQGQRGSSAMWIRLVSVREVQERLPTAQHIPEWKTSSEPRDARRNNSSLCLPRGVGRAGLLRPEPAARVFLSGGKLAWPVSEQPGARICQLSRPSMHTAGRESQAPLPLRAARDRLQAQRRKGNPLHIRTKKSARAFSP